MLEEPAGDERRRDQADAERDRGDGEEARRQNAGDTSLRLVLSRVDRCRRVLLPLRRPARELDHRRPAGRDERRLDAVHWWPR